MIEEKKENPFEATSLNLDFIDFDITPKFTGIYVKTVTLGEDEKEFDVNVFTNVETGEDVFITNAYAIEKGIKIAKEKLKDYKGEIVFEIVFKGKQSLGDKQFNKFDVSYCTIEQYKDWIKPEKKK